MKLFLKIIGYTIATVVGLVVVVFIALQFISDEQYKKWVTGAAETATGRALLIDGEFEVQVGSTLGLTAHNIRFANAEWGSREEMVTADRLLVQLRVFPLFKGVLDVTVELDTPDILMETNGEGTGNWVFDTGEQQEEQQPEAEQDATKTEEKGFVKLLVKPYIRNFRISDLLFVYADGVNDKKIEAGVETFRLFVDGNDIQLNLLAAYQGAPVELDGSLGDLKQWYTNQPTPIFLQGMLNEADLRIEGLAGPMLPKPNARIDVSISAADVATFAPFAGVELPALQRLDTSLTFIAEDGQLAADKVKLNLEDPQLLVAVQGAVANLAEVSGIDVKAEINAEQAAELLKGLGLPAQYTLPKTIRLRAGVRGNLEELAINDLELLVEDTGLDVSLTGGIENVFGTGKGSADLSVDLESSSLIGTYIGQEIPSFGPFNAAAQLSLTDETLQLEFLQIDLKDPALTAKIEGSADKISRSEVDALEISGILLSATAASEKIQEIASRAGVDVPFELPSTFRLALKSAGSSKKLEITDLQATVNDPGIEVKLSGTVDNVIDQSGIVAQLTGEVDDTAALSKFAGVEIPALGSLTLDSSLSSAVDSYRLNDFKLSLDGELVQAEINAAISDLLPLTKVTENRQALGTAGLDVSLDASIESMANLLKQAGLGVDLPEIGSLTLEGHLGSNETSLALDNLKASLTQDGLETKAELIIEDVLELRGIKAIVDGNLDSLSILSELAKTELPETGPFVLQIKAAAENRQSPVAIAAQLEGEGTRTVVDASLQDLFAPQIFETQLDIDVESIAGIGALFGKKLPKDKALQVSGKARGKPGEYRIEGLTLRGEPGEILANLTYLSTPAADKERTSIIGDLTITDFDFTYFLAAEKETAESDAEQDPDIENGALATEAVESAVTVDQGTDEQQTAEAPAERKRIFTDTPLAVGLLRDYDVDLKVNATNVRIPNGIDMSVKIAVNLDDGFLQVEPFDISQTNGGSGTGYLKLDARTREAVLDVEADFNDFVSPRFGGLFDLDINLDGQGESMADLMGSLNGYFAAALQDVELEKSFMSQFGAGLLSNLNPLDSDKTMLECAVVRFDIKDGIADFRKKIAAQTTEVTWMGGGKINLKTEELNVGIAPKARGAISGLTNVGLASLVHVGGTLAEPKIGIDFADVAKKYAGYTAHVATGGLSFVAQKIVDSAQANVDQCKKILKELKEAEMEEPKTNTDE